MKRTVTAVTVAVALLFVVAAAGAGELHQNTVFNAADLDYLQNGYAKPASATAEVPVSKKNTIKNPMLNGLAVEDIRESYKTPTVVAEATSVKKTGRIKNTMFTDGVIDYCQKNNIGVNLKALFSSTPTAVGE